MVNLQPGGSHFCGGTLIQTGDKKQSDIVVTAAHCISDGPDFKVALHRHNLNPATRDNDIAVVKLKEPVKFNSTIQPVYLPASDEQVQENTEGIVVGWGDTPLSAGDISGVLMQYRASTVSSNKCATAYKSGGFIFDSQKMLCIQGGIDSCKGDSGGPYVTKNGQGYVLQGVVSFGVGCARAGAPGIYTRVSNYINWINQQIKA